MSSPDRSRDSSGKPPTSGSRRLASIVALGSFSVVTFLAFGMAFAQTVPTGFISEKIVGPPFTGNPVAFAFLPDGRILLIDRVFASVRVAIAGNPVSTQVFTVPDVENVGSEQGLLGIAVDPHWPARPYVYFNYSQVGGYSHISMFPVTGDLTDSASVNLSFGAAYHLLVDIPDQEPTHNGGTLRFAPDGMLCASFGDDQSACTSQDETTLTGKILRLDVSGMPLSGSGPPPKSAITPSNNPFSGPDDDARLVFAWGLRNPFRFTIDSENGDLYIGDVGEATYEEINRRTGTSSAGCNYGWPRREGFIDFGFTCGEENALTNPIAAYEHGAFGNAVIGGPIYRADATDPHLFPAGYQGTVFFADVYEGWIRRLVKNGSNWIAAPPVPGQPSPTNWAQGYVNIVDFQVGTDGALYVMRLAGADKGLYRVRPTAPTGAPHSLASLSTPSVALAITIAPHPAPSGAPVNVTFEAPAGAALRVRIVDVAGRTVRDLWNGRMGAGKAAAEWDGRSNDGAETPAGYYFVCAATADGRAATRRLVRLR